MDRKRKTMGAGAMLGLLAAALLAACSSGPTAAPPLVSYVAATPVPVDVPAGPPGPPATLVNPVPDPPAPGRPRSHEAATAAAARGSAVDARDGTFEGEILNYLYRPGMRYRLVLGSPSHPEWADGPVTHLFLGPGDGTEPGVVFDDPTWFTVEKIGSGVDEDSMRSRRERAAQAAPGRRQTLVLLKCWSPGARTNATVTTPLRAYLLSLRCAGQRKPGKDGTVPTQAPAGYNSTVQFTHPREQGVAPPDPAPAPREAPARGSVVRDIHYVVDGPPEFRPREWAAWNDGENTHVRPPDAVRTRPVPMLPAATQFDVDPATGQYFVRGLPDEIRFPWGPDPAKAVVVRRRGR